jgi:hypothetical protein
VTNVNNRGLVSAIPRGLEGNLLFLGGTVSASVTKIVGETVTATTTAESEMTIDATAIGIWIGNWS